MQTSNVTSTVNRTSCPFAADDNNIETPAINRRTDSFYEIQEVETNTTTFLISNRLVNTQSLESDDFKAASTSKNENLIDTKVYNLPPPGSFRRMMLEVEKSVARSRELTQEIEVESAKLSTKIDTFNTSYQSLKINLPKTLDAVDATLKKADEVVYSIVEYNNTQLNALHRFGQSLDKAQQNVNETTLEILKSKSLVQEFQSIQKQLEESVTCDIVDSPGVLDNIKSFADESNKIDNVLMSIGPSDRP